MKVSQRVGSVSGRNQAGQLCVVSVYQDKDALKLCGPSGSVLVPDMAAILSAAANEYGLDDVAFAPSRRVA